MNAARPVSFFLSKYIWALAVCWRHPRRRRMCPATFLDNNNRRSKVFFILFSRHLESDRAQERNHLCRAADCFVFLSEKKKKEEDQFFVGKTNERRPRSNGAIKRAGASVADIHQNKTKKLWGRCCCCVRARLVNRARSRWFNPTEGPKAQEEEEENVDCFYSAITQSTFELLFFFLFFKCFCPFAFTRVSSAHARVSIR